MTRLGTLALALALASCATARKPPMTIDDATPTTSEAPLVAYGPPEASPEPEVGCLMRAPPEEPRVNWLADGCPPQYLACLSGDDAARVMRYLKNVRAWARDVYGRCARGP